MIDVLLVVALVGVVVVSAIERRGCRMQVERLTGIIAARNPHEAALLNRHLDAKPKVAPNSTKEEAEPVEAGPNPQWGF